MIMACMISPSWSASLDKLWIEQLPAYEFKTVTVNECGEVIDSQTCLTHQLILDLKNGISLELVAIPGGIFQMGSPGRVGFDDEHPQHIVNIAPFLIGKTLVTQEQWSAVMRKCLPWRFHGSKIPVENISWYDAVEFCQRLSKLTGQTCRLPSEAQWEYACKAGTQSTFTFGPTLTTDLANYVGEYIYLNEPKGIYRHTPTEGGTFPPNAFGLFDMHGNLWEWCADVWHAGYTGAPIDGSTWESGEKGALRVLRGGSWHEPPANCRSTVRLGQPPGDREDFFGFRVAIT